MAFVRDAQRERDEMARKPAFKRAAHRQCCVSIRQTTTVVVRGLGRAFLCLSLSVKRPLAGQLPKGVDVGFSSLGKC